MSKAEIPDLLRTLRSDERQEILPMGNTELDTEALDREIREEREREIARLLG